jgi:hypothetical protein
LKIRLKDGACRVRDGHLAGGGLLLPQAYTRWLRQETAATGKSGQLVFKESIGSLTRLPLWAIGIPKRVVADRRVIWTVTSDGQASCQPQPVY